MRKLGKGSETKVTGRAPCQLLHSLRSNDWVAGELTLPGCGLLLEARRNRRFDAVSRKPASFTRIVKSAAPPKSFHMKRCATRLPSRFRIEVSYSCSCTRTFTSEGLMWRPPSYSMKPNFLNLFMK